mgnify:CR=1 FL=1
MIRRLAVALAAVLAALSPAIAGASPEPPAPMVTAVEVVSRHQLTGPPVDQFLTGLTGQPFSRARVRESLDRLWALGIFDEVEVESVDEPGGVRLRFRVSRRPFLESLKWTGELGLDAADLAATAALALGGPAEPARLDRAQSEVLARLRREGYLAATVRADVRENPATNGRAVDDGRRRRQGGADRSPRDRRARARRGEAAPQGARPRPGRQVQGTQSFATACAPWRRPCTRRASSSRACRRASPPSTRATNTVDLTVEVIEGPLTIVEFLGREALKEAALRERLVFGDDRIVDDVEVRASADQIEKAYHEAGYHFAKVTGTLGGDATGRMVKFQIDEGPRVVVESITFEGRSLLTDKQLAEQMQTRPAGLIPIGIFRGLFVEEQLEQDVRLIRSYYRTQGFPSAEVGPAARDVQR